LFLVIVDNKDVLRNWQTKQNSDILKVRLQK